MMNEHDLASSDIYHLPDISNEYIPRCSIYCTELRLEIQRLRDIMSYVYSFYLAGVVWRQVTGPSKKIHGLIIE